MVYHKGFTIIETIISVAVLAIIILAITLFGRATFKLESYFTASLNTVDEARRLLRPMVNEIRSASPSVLGAYALETVESSEIVFFSDVTEDGFTERIRYFFEDGYLKRGEIVPTGSPLSYAGDEDISVLMRDVTSFTLNYYDENYDGITDTPLLEPVSPSDVRLVNIIVTVDNDPNRLPNPLGVVETNVSIRNLKSNL
jgi:prepilin-type N-terminal cleavage/methylation domain-containing protein